MGTGTISRTGVPSIWGSDISVSTDLLHKKRKNSSLLGLFKLLFYE